MGKQVVFYYVRHGETEYNREGIIQGGRVDSPLIPETLPILDKTAEALSSIPFSACWCSPLGRAQATAERIVAGRDLRIQTLDNLREFDFGELDGKAYPGNRLAFAKCFVKQDFSGVGGESGDEVRGRVQRAFKKMYKAAKDGDNVLVVAHGALLRYVVLEFSRVSNASKKLTSLTMRVPNGSIATITGDDGRFTMRTMPRKPEQFHVFVPDPDEELPKSV